MPPATRIFMALCPNNLRRTLLSLAGNKHTMRQRWFGRCRRWHLVAVAPVAVQIQALSSSNSWLPRNSPPWHGNHVPYWQRYLRSVFFSNWVRFNQLLVCHKLLYYIMFIKIDKPVTLIEIHCQTSWWLRRDERSVSSLKLLSLWADWLEFEWSI